MINYLKIFSLLKKFHQPTMLERLQDYTPFQQLIATLLSARTKDTRVLLIVKKLFQDYPLPQDLVKISLLDLEKKLYTIGFYRVKARNVQKLSQVINTKYSGTIPSTFTELTSLPGVGRKTANCILANTFKQLAIGVDTHVHRISNRLGWVKTKTPEETEAALKKILPKNLWAKVNNLLVDHGQRICLPRNPKCKECSISKYCDFGKRVC